MPSYNQKAFWGSRRPFSLRLHRLESLCYQPPINFASALIFVINKAER
jgi:hypothetical protein